MSAAGKRLDQARRVCAEAYQAFGALCSTVGVFDTDDFARVMDNLSHVANEQAGPLPHDDVLPWPHDIERFNALEKRLSAPPSGEVAALIERLRETAQRYQGLAALPTWATEPMLEAADALARLSAPVPDTDVAQNDLRDILRAVGLSDCARPYSPHEVVQRELLPHLRALRNVIEKYDGNSNNPYWAEEFNQAVRIARTYLDKPIKADK